MMDKIIQYQMRQVSTAQVAKFLDQYTESLQTKVVSGNYTIKHCGNCKFHTPEKNRCNHENWNLCVKRDDDGFVISHAYHEFR